MRTGLLKVSVSAVIAIALVFWGAIGPAPSGGLQAQAMAQGFAAGEGEGCFGCSDCEYDDYYAGHFTIESSLGLREGPEHTDCQRDICHFEHPTSDECSNALAWQDFWKAGQAQEISEIQRLLDSHGNFINLNKDRLALQLVGCDGQIIAHYPVSEMLVAEFENSRQHRALLNTLSSMDRRSTSLSYALTD